MLISIVLKSNNILEICSAILRSRRNRITHFLQISSSFMSTTRLGLMSSRRIRIFTAVFMTSSFNKWCRQMFLQLRQEKEVTWSQAEVDCRCCSRSSSTLCPKITSPSLRILREFPFNFYAPCVFYIGQAFRYSPENAFYIFNQQIYFIIWYLLDRASLI
jgi:hypothetical protein